MMYNETDFTAGLIDRNKRDVPMAAHERQNDVEWDSVIWGSTIYNYILFGFSIKQSNI